jgi:hypothetical protein
LWVTEVLVIAAIDSAAATGAAAIAVAAAPAMSSGEMKLSIAFMSPVYHFPVNLNHLIFEQKSCFS